ncbi:class I SAM-dependent methyltransferase [Sphingomonas sanguinis]|uniref:class I SAM-dependent methyltransferase n=1 Tax=Sphingomonas sp. LC-1 TaxID=3110957 RepID=UPI0021BBAF7C|nr:class I SAM-dependent methyltransferase [Sphingomonas sp. LC-1]MCT8002690.1 class I SAM-dependent methyltransferase [Sphingomonas sp. LC-1]
MSHEVGVSSPNAGQAADWNGRNGEHWVMHQVRLDRMLRSFGTAAIEAAAPAVGEHILDIGCGAGATSIALARYVGPTGHVRGIDISELLIARACAVAPHGLPLEFQLADAATADLGNGAYDLLFSRLGVMFFDDPVSAFARLRTALRRDGRLAFVCWRQASENDWVRLPLRAIADIVPSPPPPDPEAPGPFSFGDPARVTRILRQAGFTAITLTPFDRIIPFGRGETRAQAVDDGLALAFDVGPLARALQDQPEEVRTRAADAVRAALAALPGRRANLIRGTAWIVTAGNSGRSF